MNNSPFVFVSYAHKDRERVMPVIRALEQAGIALWYDEGIQAGSEWPEFVAQKVLDCRRFLLFLSEPYLESQNCRQEMTLANSEKKEMLSVHLESAKLSPGVRMQLGIYQAMFLERFPSLEEMAEALSKEPFFADCRTAPAVKTQAPAPKAPAVQRIEYSNGIVYEGEMKNGLRHGKGTLRYANGIVYEGDFVDGLPHGKGTLTFPNGDVYEGDFVQNERTGKGTLRFRNGNVYEGDFLDGKRHGKGVFRWKEGKVYEGDFLHDQRTGKGMLRLPNGDVYEGDFLDGKRHGKGTIRYANGIVFKGEFFDDQQSGKGTTFFPNGDVFEGNYVNGRHQGKGKRIFSNGDVYEGEFLYGKCTGQGTLWRNDGFLFRGSFRDAELIEGSVYDKNGNFVCRFQNGKRV